MDLHKAVALVIITAVVLLIPLFIWFFVKMLYHYQKMIFGIKKAVYSHASFILGPFLIANEKNFDEMGVESRLLFFQYLRKAIIVFSVMLALLAIIKLLRHFFSG